MVKHELSTVSAVIDALGGTKAVATLTNRKTDSVVSNWRTENTFPTTTYFVLQAALKQKRMTAPDKLWRIEPAVVS